MVSPNSDQCDSTYGKTLVMRYTQTQEWRVPIGDSLGRAVESCIHQSGIAWGRDIDPETIRFIVE